MANALLDEPSAPGPASIRGAHPWHTESRFAAHRHNAMFSLINALGARFPVVRRLLCEDSFRTLAHRYVMAEPPQSPALLQYGDTFPHFIRRCGAGASADYLADIAELERARGRACQAADAAPFDCTALAAMPPARLHAIRLVLHPSLVLLSSRFPIVSLWEANQPGGDNTLYRWGPECALVARPVRAVEIRRLPPGGFAFLKTLAGGSTIAAGIEAGKADAEAFDLATNFAVLMEANVVTGVTAPGSCKQG